MTRQCGICNATDVPIRHGLVAWKEPVFGKYEDVDRCIDVDACRARVEAAGDRWPIEDPKAAA